MSTRASWVGVWAMTLLLGLVVSLLSMTGIAPTWAQESPDQIQTGDEIVIPPHWSPYQAPTSYPEGTRLHIIVRGDTLWDLSNQYLENPFLWPQLWDANRYITDPHWIYPGDPLVIPDLDVLRAADEEPGVGEGEEVAGVGEPGAEGLAGPAGPSLFPIFEEDSIQCMGYLSDKEDEGLRIFATEEGDAKIRYAVGDIVYLNRGLSDGIQAGDVYYIQERERKVPGGGWYINRTGWLDVLAVQEKTATAEITFACDGIVVGSYLKPFEPIPVPLVPIQAPVTRLDPETGQSRGRIVDSHDNVGSLGQGYLVSLDVGEENGVIPGNIFTIFRFVHPDAPRRVLGEAAILTVRRKTSTAKITLSYSYMKVGDLVELK